MSNRKDLKAYVRYDGSGRVVPSSLVLRKTMPKNGKWVEVAAYECCNPTTTTTSTTSSGFPEGCYQVILTGNIVAPTAWLLLYCGETRYTLYQQVDPVETVCLAAEPVLYSGIGSWGYGEETCETTTTTTTAAPTTTTTTTAAPTTTTTTTVGG